MRVVGLIGVAVLALSVSVETQAIDWLQPADCASLEANSLEAAILKCDPVNLLGATGAGSGPATAEGTASWPEPTEDPALGASASDGEPVAIGISSTTR